MKKYEFQSFFQYDLQFFFIFLFKLNLVFEISEIASGPVHVVSVLDFPFYTLL